jgi:hypothetical protein
MYCIRHKMIGIELRCSLTGKLCKFPCSVFNKTDEEIKAMSDKMCQFQQKK